MKNSKFDLFSINSCCASVKETFDHFPREITHPNKSLFDRGRIIKSILSSSFVKSVRIPSFSGPYFPAFGLNMEPYGVSLRIQFECRKNVDQKNFKYGHFSRNGSFSPQKRVKRFLH